MTIFQVKGTPLNAWLYLPKDLSKPVPCIIMGNGLGVLGRAWNLMLFVIRKPAFSHWYLITVILGRAMVNLDN